jgi:predicted dehydrogenase
MTLVAACDPKTDRAEAKRLEYLKAFPDAAVSVFADYREMLAKVRPDIVSIASESGYHAQIALMRALTSFARNPWRCLPGTLTR